MIKTEIKGISIQLNTSQAVFSPSNVDRGTLAMLSQVDFNENDYVLDLGCGCGIVGILAAKLIGGDRVTMCDVSKEAIALTKENVKLNEVEPIAIHISNGLDQIEEKGFTLILSNPPYHVDFSVPKNFIEKGYQKLLVGGKMYMVTKRKEWYKNKLISVFGGVKVLEVDGYYVFIAEKREKKPQKLKKEKPQLSKKLQKKVQLRNKSRR